MARPQISVFDDNGSDRVASATRWVERQSQNTAPGKSGGTTRGLQVRFGKTAAGSEAYPSDPATVFNWRPVERKPASLTVGDQAIADSPWQEGIRKGTSVGGFYIPVDTLCLAFKIGGGWWLLPIDGPCDFIPMFWSEIDGWVAEERQVLMHAADACPAWVTVSTRPCPEPEP